MPTATVAVKGFRKEPPKRLHRVCSVTVDFPGLGTVINVVTVVVGAGLGMAVGHRLHEHTRSVVTDVLGLVTLLVAGLSARQRRPTPPCGRPPARAAPVLIVLGSLLIGSIAGSLLRIEARLEGLAGTIQTGSRCARRSSASEEAAPTTRRASGSSRAG